MVCIINFTFWCQECWKSHFRASKFQNFLGAHACPQTPLEKVALGHLNSHSRLLLYGQTPTSNLIESPAATTYPRVRVFTETTEVTSTVLAKQNRLAFIIIIIISSSSSSSSVILLLLLLLLLLSLLLRLLLLVKAKIFNQLTRSLGNDCFIALLSFCQKTQNIHIKF